MKRTTTHITAQADSRRRSLPGSAEREVRRRIPARTAVAIAAAALLLPALTACTIVSREVRTSDEPIAFASFVPDVTKAVVENAEGMENAFAVWGYRTPVGGDAADVLTVFDGDEVYRDDNTAPWTYDIPRFWVEGHYDFYAIHPYPDGTDISKPAADAEVTASYIAGQGISIVLNSPKADIDLMTATASRDYPLGGDGAVAFTFEHLLSRVSIQAGAAAGNVQITSLTFSGMYDGGSYNGSAWDFTDQTADGSISLPEGNGPIDISPESSVHLLSDLLLIPQTPTQSCTIVLQYSVSGQPRTPVILPIPSEPVWEAGRQYVYTVSVAADVTMTVDVVDWTVYDFNIEW